MTGAVLSVCDLSDENTVVGFRVLDRAKFPLPEGWHAEPIPLTEEWMIKLPFEPDSDANGWQMKISEHAFLWWGKYERVIRLVFTEVDYSYPLYLRSPTFHLQFVHQLQNLFFALTGEELMIKELA